MSSSAEIAAAFSTVDELLLAAAAAAPAVALLAARAAEQGVTPAKLGSHLGMNATVMAWVLRIGPDATTDRLDLDGADVGELVLRWARAG